jgi:hypothetical protein
MIKCHFCKHELEVPYAYGGSGIYPNSTYECPNGHAHVIMDSKDIEIIDYLLYWDADPDANDRYKLVGTQAGTFLHHSSLKKRYVRNYQCIFETASFIPVPIKENTIQMDNLVARLKRMGVFS